LQVNDFLSNLEIFAFVKEKLLLPTNVCEKWRNYYTLLSTKKNNFFFNQSMCRFPYWPYK